MAFHSLTKITDRRIKGRWYLHQDQVTETFGDDPRRKCKELWPRAMDALEKEVGIPPYVLGFFFAYNREPVLDLFVPRSRELVSYWGGEPVYQAFQYHQSELSTHPGIYPCSDVLTVLAAEETWRRKSRGLDHFLSEVPSYRVGFVRMPF